MGAFQAYQQTATIFVKTGFSVGEGQMLHQDQISTSTFESRERFFRKSSWTCHRLSLIYDYKITIPKAVSVLSGKKPSRKAK